MQEAATAQGSLLPSIGETASNALSIDVWDLDLTGVKGRLDDTMLAKVQAVAKSPLPALSPCDEPYFLKCLRTMKASLPRRLIDDVSGELMAETYQQALGGKPKRAIGFLAAEAIKRCQWFPTIAECLTILAEWERNDPASQIKAKAEVLARGEMQARLGDVLKVLERRDMPQAEIDALPDQWKRVAAEKCLLWAWPDGRFTVRKDIEKMDPEAAEAERERNRVMFAEWREINKRKAAAAAEAEKAA